MGLYCRSAFAGVIGANCKSELRRRRRGRSRALCARVAQHAVACGRSTRALESASGRHHASHREVLACRFGCAVQYEAYVSLTRWCGAVGCCGAADAVGRHGAHDPQALPMKRTTSNYASQRLGQAGERAIPAEAKAMQEKDVAHYQAAGRRQALADFNAKCPVHA